MTEKLLKWLLEHVQWQVILRKLENDLLTKVRDACEKHLKEHEAEQTQEE